MKNQNDTVLLPNNITCNIIELYDSLCISYLATHYMLTKNNIYPSDNSPNNLFIHWLNDNSYHNDKNIKNLTEIVYKIGNKYFKIKTFGFVLILGDIGTYIIKIKEDVILTGDSPTISHQFHNYKLKMTDKYNNMEFINSSYDMLTRKQLKNTIVNKIINSEPYCNCPIYQNNLLQTDYDLLKNLKSTPELLDYFYDKYGIKNYKEHNNSILIG